MTAEEIDHRRAAEVMQAIDQLKPEVRALVYEYGFMIVHHLMYLGFRKADKLEPELIQWREKRQEEWLSTDYVMSKQAYRSIDA